MQEARRRGLTVTPVVRDPGRHPEVEGAVAGDATSAELVEKVARGHDVAVSVVASLELDLGSYAEAIRELLTGLERAGVRRLVGVGIGTTMAGEDGVRGFERPDFPEQWRPFSRARADELAVLEGYTGPVDWVLISPSVQLTDDETESLTDDETESLTDDETEEGLSYLGVAKALLDEVVQERYHRVQLGI
jgi:putative NADH-flavin reductase